MSGSNSAASASYFTLWNVDPREVARPGETSDLKRFRVAVVVLEGLVVDNIYDRNEHGFSAFLDPLK